MKYLKDTRSIRFKEVYSMLRETGKVKGQDDFAHKIGAKTHQIYTLMQCKTRPSIEMLTKLHQVFNINMNYIFDKSSVMLIAPKDTKIDSTN